MVCAFSSPIHTGGGGGKRRLKSDPAGAVWQDAAYWVPLLPAYTFMSREEACGLECVEVIFDVTTPFLLVKANMTKSRDGIHAAATPLPDRGPYTNLPLRAVSRVTSESEGAKVRLPLLRDTIRRRLILHIAYTLTSLLYTIAAEQPGAGETVEGAAPWPRSREPNYGSTTASRS